LTSGQGAAQEKQAHANPNPEKRTPASVISHIVSRPDMKKQTSQDTPKSRVTPYDASELPTHGKKYHISHFSSSYNSMAIRDNRKTGNTGLRASRSVQIGFTPRSTVGKGTLSD
jgi:hypothetical protein